MTPEEKALLEAHKEEAKQAVANDIAAMDAVLGGSSVSEEVKTTETEVDIFTGEETEVKNQRVGEAGPDDLVEEVRKAATQEQESEESEKEDETDAYDFSFINELARQALERGVSQVPVAPPEQVAPAAPAVAPTQPLAAPVQAPTPANLVTLDEMTEAFDSPEKMLGLLHRVYERARADALQQALIALPNAVRPVVATEATFVEKVKAFYDEHKELNPYRDFVKYCAVQVENEHPDWGYEQVMTETAKLAKKRLPMLREAMQRESRIVKPSFADPGKSTTKPSAKKMSRLEQELASMPDY